LQLLKRVANSPLLAWLLGLSLVIFQVLAVGIWVNGGTFPGDIEILQILHRTSTPSLDRFAETFTFLGIVGGVIPAAVFVALDLLFRRQWEGLLSWSLISSGITVIAALAKLLWHRARPHLWNTLYPFPKDFSFPSGHAAASMTLVAALLLLTWETRWRWFVLSFGGLFVIGIGWTRIYLGVHYPSDVAAGWMLAISWVSGFRLFLQPQLWKLLKEKSSTA
jgi:membrane-associated phospholipid phosphatase